MTLWCYDFESMGRVSNTNREKCKPRAKMPKQDTIQRKLLYIQTLCILVEACLRLRFRNIGVPNEERGPHCPELLMV